MKEGLSRRSALAHMIGYYTHLSLRTILLLVTAELADPVLRVAPLVHPGTVLNLALHQALPTYPLTSGRVQSSPSESEDFSREGEPEEQA